MFEPHYEMPVIVTFNILHFQFQFYWAAISFADLLLFLFLCF